MHLLQENIAFPEDQLALVAVVHFVETEDAEGFQVDVLIIDTELRHPFTGRPFHHLHPTLLQRF